MTQKTVKLWIKNTKQFFAPRGQLLDVEAAKKHLVQVERELDCIFGLIDMGLATETDWEAKECFFADFEWLHMMLGRHAAKERRLALRRQGAGTCCTSNHTPHKTNP